MCYNKCTVNALESGVNKCDRLRETTVVAQTLKNDAFMSNLSDNYALPIAVGFAHVPFTIPELRVQM